MFKDSRSIFADNSESEFMEDFKTILGSTIPAQNPQDVEQLEELVSCHEESY